MKKKNPLTSQLRIIGGKWRGRKIQFPAAEGLRPTGDRIRETLFNWLAPVIDGARCLDLFAGSGALTFEALSRGAAAVVAVDSQRQVVEQLQASGRLLQCDSAVTVVHDQAQRWLQQAAAGGPFDIVFLDPPFQAQLVAPICEQLHHSGLLAPDALIYIEYAQGQVPAIPANWLPLKQKHAGQVRYALYQYPG